MSGSNAQKTLTGKLALVTGGTSGLGRAIAQGLAQSGADLIIVSRKEAECDRVARDIAEATGSKTYGLACHLGDWNEIDRLLTIVHGRHGALDILVNNAGMSPPYASLAEVSVDLFDKTIAVNLRATFRLCAVVGAQMAAERGGCIINVSSGGATRPDTTALPYCAAKAGVETLTTGFAKALGPKVRVNCIVPGAFETRASQHWAPKTVESYSAEAVLGRIGDPEEVVGAAVYLAGPGASFTTGAILRVDGGLGL